MYHNMEKVGSTESRNFRQRQILYDITYMWNLKQDTNALIYETETDSQTQRTDAQLPRRREVEEGWNGTLELGDANQNTQDG